MMQINTQVTLPFPRPLVYQAYRDHLLELTPYLTNVREIEVKSREEKNPGLHLVLVWHGGGEIPLAARALLSDAMLSWTDVTDWHDAEFVTDWQIQTHAFTEAVQCLGKNIFIDSDQQTLIKSQGRLTIDPHKIKGVPGFLAGVIAQAVEDYLGQKIEPNFRQLAGAVQQYLQTKTKFI
ncbi:hypothetical protein RIF25_04480 [Thermosynechococcaceae cyanobacterium BACA0444]|uniref:Uncharacterized protein n=2 Tax=Pseudocalidococcus TaxID=3110321 RepID=A0AAE4FQ35_9CYAN|nr:hypothetical protein [Pseudocalidococcus azoricus]MDS3860060.1 hypothetical protein [Pseudocalidococcus azoricus BACA0444]